MNEPSQSATLAHREPEARPLSASWRRRLPLAFILLSGASLSFILFFIVREAETKRLDADFERRSTIPVVSIQSAIDEHVALLQSIAAFYFSSHQVERDEFRAFTQAALQRLPALQCLTWSPRVTADTRATHEATVRAEGYKAYEITQNDPGGRVRAGDRTVYFPVVFALPEKSNSTILGLDLASDDLLLQTMDAARSQNMPVSARLSTATYGNRAERVYRTLMPVYQNQAPYQTPADRQQNIAGYAMAVIHPARLIDSAVKKLPVAYQRTIAVQAIDAGSAGEVIYSSEGWPEKAAAAEARSIVKLAGRTWQIICRPVAGTATAPLWQSWAVLVAGLVLTTLVAAYLSAMWDRAAKVETQVLDRTAQLAHERYLVDSLMDTVPDHIYYKDTRSRFLRINKSMAGLFNLKSPVEAVGKTDFDFFTAEHAQRAFEDEQEILRTGEPIVGREEKETWPDGSVTWVSTTKQALRDPFGKIIGTFGISRDITERKHAEQHLAEKARELERSNTELEQFAYVASHDLQEPLRMVASYTQLLGRRYKDKLGPEADEFITYAVEGATRMQLLINDLLAYSRVGRGKPLSPVSSGESLARALANLKIAIEETAALITCDSTFEPSTPDPGRSTLPIVMADATQLTQLFQNLISNALKFRSPDLPPRIHITASDVCTAPDKLNPSSARDADLLTARAHQWLFCVSDNGIGIEPKHFERIFVLFQRLHTREQYPGTGIGLAVCKKIVERHGGIMWVESAPGKGSTFCFTLPKVTSSTR
jgi:PAS domain S-box-containing protein